MLCILIVISLLVGIGYTYFLSPTDCWFNKYTYKSSDLPDEFDGFTIAFFSDCNIKDEEDLERLEKIVEKLNKRSFDMCIFGGDLFEDEVYEGDEVSKILKNIDCYYGKFAVLGDRDEATVESILNEGGFEVVSDAQRKIYYNDAKISLLCLDEEVASSLVEEDDELFELAVAHKPDTFENNYDSINLQLSGHSNGGYIYLPLLGSFITSEGCETYNHGRYKKENATLLITNGIKGTSDFPYKLFAYNEVNLITLKCE